MLVKDATPTETLPMNLNTLPACQLAPFRHLASLPCSLLLKLGSLGIGQIKLEMLITALRARILILVDQLLILLDDGFGADHLLELRLGAQVLRRHLVVIFLIELLHLSSFFPLSLM